MARKSTATNRKRPSTTAARRAAVAVRPAFWQQSEFWGLIVILVGLVTALSLALPDRGSVGSAWSLALRQVFGLGAYPVALGVLAGGVLLLARRNLRRPWAPRWQVVVGGEMAYFGGLGLIHILAGGSPTALYYEGRAGGIIGWAFWRITVPYLGVALSALLLGALALGGIYLAAGVHWRILAWRARWLWAGAGVRLRAAIQAGVARRPAPAPVSAPPVPARRPATIHPAPFERPAQPRPAPAAAPHPARPAARRRVPALPTVGGLPPVDLLVPDVADSGDDTDARQKAQIIEDTLEAFGIPAQVVEWHRGPVVTQFGVEPGFVERQDREGTLHRFKVRVSKILALTNDLALALAAESIRIEAPVPGRSVVGIEVPNSAKAMVGLRGVIEANQFRKVRSRLAIAMGRDVSGEAFVADLAAMPHLLIAGATGSGKSVCLNASIVSLLYQNTADELKLLLIDPKRVELTRYNGIPHLLAPVVVDVEKVIVALRWMTREMDRRYQEFANVGARNLQVYNKMAPAKGLEPLPLIVVIIDELADLMLAAPDDVERTICRLAQMARATGIHLVIATQRPSVDVVTGLIKANFPARISFAVTSQIDSRVILDTPGAEKLLGRGDMLFMSPDSAKLQRIQGCFVSDGEVEDLVHLLRQQAIEAAVAAAEVSAAGGAVPAEEQRAPWEDLGAEEAEGGDELLQNAITLVRQHRQASASFLQRHMRIGYPRAARLIDELEELGIVGRAESGGRSRAVLDDPETDAEALPTDDLLGAGEGEG